MTVATQAAPLPAHELVVFEPNQLPKLRSNHGKYLDESSVGWMKPTPIDTPLAEVRRRFEADGYVWMKNVMPREDVYDMRQAYFEHLAPTGILKPGTSPREGIFDESQDPIAHNGVGGSDLPEDIERQNKLTSIHQHPFYHAFLEHPKLRSFIRDFMGWKKDVILKRTLLRHNVPNGFSTGIHYDRIFLRRGEDFLTAWVPIGDCTAQGGGLVYMEDSTDIGKEIEDEFAERAKDFTPEERISAFNKNMARDGQLSHNIVELTEDIGSGKYGRKGTGRRRWVVGNYEAGDVVFHNPYTIHGALKNEDPLGRIRLACDLRFYEEGAPMDERWMQHEWRPNDGL